MNPKEAERTITTRDAELLYRRWAFDVTKIERRVHLWQGTDDHLVPAAINKPIADRMPGAVWHSVDGAGHFVAVGAADEILAVTAGELGAQREQIADKAKTWWG